MEDTRSIVRVSAGRKILFLPHAVKQMSRHDRMIDRAEVRRVIEFGELIEDYPDDPRGPSCLLVALCQGRPIHVVCAPKEEYLAVITAYIPDDKEWQRDWKTRNRS